MSSLALDGPGTGGLAGWLVGQGLTLSCWVAAVALGRAAWRRRRGDVVSDLLVLGGLMLGGRLVLLLAGPWGLEWGGPGWLAVALDLAGLVLVAWPFLAPPLPVRWADRLAGAGLAGVAAGCCVALWQWVRGWIGLSTVAPGFTIAWSHGALLLAGLAALNLARHLARRTWWLVTAGCGSVAGIAGLAIGLDAPAEWSFVVTAFAAALAVAWLNWLDLARRRQIPAAQGSGRSLEPQVASQLLETSTSLFAAHDLAQVLQMVTNALEEVLRVRVIALFLASGEDQEHLRLFARWPQSSTDEALSSLPEQSSRALADVLVRGEAVNVAHGPDGAWPESLSRVLGVDFAATAVFPLTGEYGARGLLVLGHDGAPLRVHQLQLCRILADQVAISAGYIQLRVSMGQQSRNLARLVRRHEQEGGRLRAILESIADGVIVSDADDQVVMANSAALDILGVARGVVLGRPFGQILGRMVPAGEIGLVGTLIEQSPRGSEALFEVAGRVVQMSMAPVETREQSQLGVVAVMRDITALATAEAERERLLVDLQERSRQLEEAALRLQELDQLKAQFITNMSHELRTPLNSVIGFAGLLLRGMDGSLSDMQRQDVELIHTSGKHLLTMINSLLDISRVWAGKLDLMLADVRVREVIDEAVAAAEALVGERPVELRVELEPDLPLIRADGARVGQVVLSLLDNAVKYTEKGHVTVSASQDGDFVVISVADTGIGIGPEHLEMIFEEFGRVDDSSTRSVDGLGLGLAISRNLVELHGGQIWVDSEPGVGSAFSFSLPIAGPASVPAAREAMRRRLQKAMAEKE